MRLNWQQKPLNIRTMVYLKKSNGLVILLLTAIFTLFSCSDDDSAPEDEVVGGGALLRADLSVAPATIVEGESAVITLTLDAPNNTGANLVFDFSFGGTVDPESDVLSLVSTQLTIASGATETSLMVDSIDDTEAEMDETFTLDISDGIPSGAVAGTTTNITLTITDND